MCPAGFFQADIVQLECKYCPMGFYSECRGRNNCLQCEAGQTTYEEDSPFTKCRAKQLATVQPVFLEGTGVNVSKESGFQNICLNWNVPASENELLLPSKFDEVWLQWSYFPNFDKEDTNTTILFGNATRGCIRTGEALHLKVVYFRVR